MEKIITSKDPLYIEQVGDEILIRVGRFVENTDETVMNYTYLIEIKLFDYSPEKVKKHVLGVYNRLCDEEILSGLTYEGSLVWLSSENQFNYKAAFDFAIQTQGSNLPVKIKLGTDSEVVYKTFDTIESFQEFIVEVMNHINSTLAKYWDIKDGIDWARYEID